MEPQASGLVIDWRLLFLQVVNFLILFGILTWLIWKPLLKMLDERRRVITEGLAAAEAQKKAAAQYEAVKAKLLAEAREEATKLLTDARAELKTERETLRAELKADRDRHQQQLLKERGAMHRQLDVDVRRSVGKLLAIAAERLFTGPAADPKTWQSRLETVVKEIDQ
ncbi:ATP synthase F0 subunit B [Candidatus Berkelbacteria bacterium]|nr:ATP synthase F0 subunit B [Candidatus Berkelbacteria bacterium]